MAVEAQLCPQCGATVHFAEMQTEVVCSYCGATVDKSLLQAIQHVNDVDELSAENQNKLNQLILDGRRQDALFFIQQYTGLGEAHASDEIDSILSVLIYRSDRERPASNTSMAFAIANMLFLLAMVAAMLGGSVLSVIVKSTAATAISFILGIGGFILLLLGIFPMALVLFAGPGRQIQNRVSAWLGKPALAVLQKVVPLKSSQGPKAQTIITRLQVEVTPPGQQPRVIETVMELPQATVDSLKPGAKIEVITNGPKVLITNPIKVLG